TLLGGVAFYAGVQDIELTGTCTPAGPSNTASSQFTWTFEGADYRYETQSATGHGLEVSNHGQPSYWYASSSAALSKISNATGAHFQAPFYLPGLMLYRAL